MLYNEENKEHVVVLTGSDKNNMTVFFQCKYILRVLFL